MPRLITVDDEDRFYASALGAISKVLNDITGFEALRILVKLKPPKRDAILQFTNDNFPSLLDLLTNATDSLQNVVDPFQDQFVRTENIKVKGSSLECAKN